MVQTMTLRSTLITVAIVIVVLLFGAFLTSRGMNPLDRVASRPTATGTAPPTGGAGTGG